MTEGNELKVVDEKDLMTGGGGFNLAPSNLGEAMQFAKMMANTDMVPKDYQGKPANIMVAVQMGAEVGLKPLQALQNIACINGRPSIWGDAAIALVKVHPDCESIDEYLLTKNGEKTTGDDYDTAVCVIKRRGQEEQIRTFSLADAKKARLLGKSGPWTTHQKRMLQLRARGFNLRDTFPDALKGLAIAEEAQDLPAHTAGPTDIIPSSERISTPEFSVPSIDTEREIMVDRNTEVVDVTPGVVDVEPEVVDTTTKVDNSKPKAVNAASEESPFEDESTPGVPQSDLETVVITAKDLVERISKFDNHFEHQNWMPKHLSEINSLDATDQAIVMKAYAEKGEEINGNGEELSEAGYKALIGATETKTALNELWFNRIEKEVSDSKVKIRLRSCMNKKAGELKGN